MWQNSTINGYADDTSSTTESETLEGLKECVQNEAQNILKYMSINCLAANADKTAIIIIRKSGQKSDALLSFKIGNEVIHESRDEMLLGVHVSHNLGWRQQLQNLNTNLNYRLLLLRRLSNIMQRNLLKTVANGIFISN